MENSGLGLMRPFESRVMASGQSLPMPAHEPVIFFSPSTNSNGRIFMTSCSPMMPKDESCPAAAQHGKGLLVGLDGADSLDDVVGAAASGELLHLFHRVLDVVDVDDVVRAHLLGDLQTLAVVAEDDHRRAGLEHGEARRAARPARSR